MTILVLGIVGEDCPAFGLEDCSRRWVVIKQLVHLVAYLLAALGLDDLFLSVLLVRGAVWVTASRGRDS